MSWEDLLKLFSKILDFKLFEINQTPVTVTSILVFLLFFIGLTIISRLISNTISSRLLSRMKIDKGTRYNFQRIIYYLLISISAIFSFQFVGIDLSGLAVIFGLLSVGIGFGLQNITSNFISGLILLFERPIKVGDRVTVGDILGEVTDINMRSTTIKSLQNVSIIVPNSDFVASKVINWSHRDPKIRLDVDVGVSYNSELEIVKKALLEVADEHDKVLNNPAPQVLLMSFGDSSWNMQLRAWIQDPRGQFVVRSDLNSAIVYKFRKYDVEIPYPQRDLHIRSSKDIPVHLKNGSHGFRVVEEERIENR